MTSAEKPLTIRFRHDGRDWVDAADRYAGPEWVWLPVAASVNLDIVVTPKAPQHRWLDRTPIDLTIKQKIGAQYPALVEARARIEDIDPETHGDRTVRFTQIATDTEDILDLLGSAAQTPLYLEARRPREGTHVPCVFRGSITLMRAIPPACIGRYFPPQPYDVDGHYTRSRRLIVFPDPNPLPFVGPGCLVAS